MTRRPRGARLTRGRRGAVLPLVCILIVVLLGAAALAIDLGRLYVVGQELQTAADAAALAGERAWQRYPDFGSYGPSVYLSNLGGRNRAGSAAPAVTLAPATYDPATRTVTTTGVSWSYAPAVQATASVRPSYILAGIFGLTAPTLTRTATAWAANVNGMTCVRPFTLPYTRNWEHGTRMGDSTWTRNWFTGGSPYAPEYSYHAVASLQENWPYNNDPPGRTYVMLPPWEREGQWDNDGANHWNSGTWKPADFTGGGVSDYTTLISASPGSSPGTSSCRRATAKVGDILNPLPHTVGTSDRTAFLNATATGMALLCNRVGNNTDARCFDSRGNFGVKTRVAATDSVFVGGVYKLRVREVTQVRVVCYWRTPADVCPSTPLSDGYNVTNTWSNWGAASGYPAGTIAVVLDGPVTMDITPDVVLGTKVGITQRLMLVR